MIRHVLRQERTGGYWLIRDEGRVIDLDAARYERMARVCDAGGHLPAGEWNAAGTLVREWQAHGLGTVEAWREVRHVRLGHGAPADAGAAPKRIYFEITRACNLRCQSCFNNSGKRLPDELSAAEVLDVNRQAFEMGVFEIRYTGGECTLLREFPEMVADARRRGIYVSVGTNGVYTDEQFERLADCGIDWFIVSLDGGRELNDRVRGAGSFDHVLRTLGKLSALGARLRLNMVVARHNTGGIEEVARVAAENGVESVNLIPLRPYGRSVSTMLDDMFGQRDFYDFIREVNRLRREFPQVAFSTTIDLLDAEAVTSHDRIVQKKRTCAAGVEACVVGPLGHVYGCSYSPASFPNSADTEGVGRFVAGNIRSHTLERIWRESERWQVFRDLEQFKNPKCHACHEYAVRCAGSCQIMAWFQIQQARDGGKIRDFCDPYCFIDLLGKR